MMYQTYDSWKAHNPADEELGSCPQPGQSEELEKPSGELEAAKARIAELKITKD
jgi:hypothetical protein